MNKINRLILVGLMFFGVHNARGMGQEQREILYTLHTLEQDFAQVPMIIQNIDMFMGVMEMNIQLTEIQLKTATQKLKTAAWKNAALFSGAIVSKLAFNQGVDSITLLVACKGYHSLVFDTIKAFLSSGVNSLVGPAISLYVTLNIHGAWKKRSELQQSLALDKEILSKLQEIKDATPNSGVAEKILSEKASISSLGE